MLGDEITRAVYASQALCTQSKESSSAADHLLQQQLSLQWTRLNDCNAHMQVRLLFPSTATNASVLPVDDSHASQMKGRKLFGASFRCNCVFSASQLVLRKVSDIVICRTAVRWFASVAKCRL